MENYDGNRKKNARSLEPGGRSALFLLAVARLRGGLPAVAVVAVVGLDAGGRLLALLEPLVLAVSSTRKGYFRMMMTILQE